MKQQQRAPLAAFATLALVAGTLLVSNVNTAQAEDPSRSDGEILIQARGSDPATVTAQDRLRGLLGGQLPAIVPHADSSGAGAEESGHAGSPNGSRARSAASTSGKRSGKANKAGKTSRTSRGKGNMSESSRSFAAKRRQDAPKPGTGLGSDRDDHRNGKKNGWDSKKGHDRSRWGDNKWRPPGHDRGWGGHDHRTPPGHDRGSRGSDHRKPPGHDRGNRDGRSRGDRSSRHDHGKHRGHDHGKHRGRGRR
ncbi:hypothetical protein [Nocardioides daejeonensis]|uniref:hypothetical protein n=1 Tax=Nocardioides daejeonensis TaxID=1046556 RepID=UPI000D740D6A|nr:hypothetical protein [Nocardioides daejeonensis]